MSNGVALAVVLCALAAGCVGPEAWPDWRTEIYPPGTEPALEKERPSERRPPPEGPVKGLTIEKAFALAEELHPDLAAERARVEAADARALQAGRYPNPELVGRMESAPFEAGTTREAEYVAGLSQRLPIGGRLGAASRVEELERDRLFQEYQVRRLEVWKRVHGAFAAALYMEEVINLQTEALRISDNAVTVVRARVAAGDALPEELARVEMEQVRTRLELERAQSLRDLAFLALATAVGEPRLRLETLEGALETALEIPTLESLLASLGQSPFVTSAEANVAVQHARVELAEAQRIPDVNLDLFYRRIEGTETDAFDVGIGIAIPLFDRNQGRIRETRSDVVAAEARARSTRNELERKVREAHATLARAVAQSRVLREEILPRAETVLKGAEARYSAGDTSLSDVLLIRRDRTAVGLAYLESLRDVMEAWVRLRPLIQTR